MDDIKYHNKYIKYKTKYIKLRKNINHDGGGFISTDYYFYCNIKQAKKFFNTNGSIKKYSDIIDIFKTGNEYCFMGKDDESKLSILCSDDYKLSMIKKNSQNPYIISLNQIDRDNGIFCDNEFITSITLYEAHRPQNLKAEIILKLINSYYSDYINTCVAINIPKLNPTNKFNFLINIYASTKYGEIESDNQEKFYKIYFNEPPVNGIERNFIKSTIDDFFIFYDKVTSNYIPPSVVYRTSQDRERRRIARQNNLSIP